MQSAAPSLICRDPVARSSAREGPVSVPRAPGTGAIQASSAWLFQMRVGSAVFAVTARGVHARRGWPGVAADPLAPSQAACQCAFAAHQSLRSVA